MTTDSTAKEATQNPSQLIASLREGVSVVQMIVFKEVKNYLVGQGHSKDPAYLPMLAGSITNEAFGTRNSAEKFSRFRENNRTEIEQGLLAIREELANICPILTDALRIQTLCDHQEGQKDTTVLSQAKEFGFLLEEREVPLPSTFMTEVRKIGEKHNLIIPPVQISATQDQSMVH